MSDWSRILRRAGRIASAAISSAAASRTRTTDSSRVPRPRGTRTTPGTEWSPRTPGSSSTSPTTPELPNPSPAPHPGHSAGPGLRKIETPEVPGSPAYPGDFTGTVHAIYQPSLDGDADPGEIVWTWVPFEEDHTRGKDRPALVVGRDGRWLLGLMLTSKDHDRDAADEARWGRRWLDIGSGPWDSRGRDSEVRLDRVLRLDPGAVRREGAIMDRATFDRVATAIAG